MQIKDPHSPETGSLSGYSTELLEEMYRRMFLIRSFELSVNDYFLKGFIPGTIHLSHGQEAVPVGITSALRPDDLVLPTHRGHGHALAKGMSPLALFAELFARQAGCCGGKGGSLHISDVARGIMPPSPLVGSSVPVAAGMAFAFKYKKSDRVVASFFGDGAINTGPFHEGVNLAAIWNLPIVLVCENNQYAITTPIRTVTRLNRLSDQAAAYGIPGVTLDGNDVIAVYEAAQVAVTRARAGEGPTYLECITYRQGGHKRDDPARYRPQEEVQAWLARDPITRFRKRLLDQGVLAEAVLDTLERKVRQGLELAAQQALESPAPEPDSVMAAVYA